MYPYTKQIEPTATTKGEFSDGNPQLNQARTILRSYWPNMVQRELLAILQAAGITPAQENYTQVKQAIQALINSGDASVLQSAINQDSALNTSLRSYIDEQVTSAISQAAAYTSQSQIGTVIAAPFTSLPNHLPLKGDAYNRADYPLLWALIDSYGNPISDDKRADYPGAFTKGNGINTFRVPNMGGLFVRGVGGNSFGAGVLQGDAARNATGSFDINARYSTWAGDVIPDAGGVFTSKGQSTGVVGGMIDNDHTRKAGQRIEFSLKSDDYPTAPENRPINVAWNYFIRAI